MAPGSALDKLTTLRAPQSPPPDNPAVSGSPYSATHVRLRVAITCFAYAVLCVALHEAGRLVTPTPSWRVADFGAGLAVALLLAFGARWIPLVAVSLALTLWVFPDRRFFTIDRVIFIGAFYGILYGLVWCYVRRRMPRGFSPPSFKSVAWFVFGTFGVSLGIAPLVWISRLMSTNTGGLNDQGFVEFAAMIWGYQALGILTVAPAMMVYVALPLRRWIGLARPSESPAQESRSPFDNLVDRMHSVDQLRPPLDIIRLAIFTALIAANIQLTAWFKHQYGLDFLYLSLLPLFWVAVRHGVPLTSALLLSGNCAALVVFRFGELGSVLPILDLRVLLASSSVMSLALAAMVGELQRRSDQLDEKDNRFQAIYEAEPESICLLGLDGTVLAMNRAARELLKPEGPSEASEVSFSPFYKSLREEDRENLRTAIARARLGEAGVVALEIGANGDRRWLESHFVPVRDSNSSVEAILAVTRDNTRRRLDEEAQRFSEEKFSKAFRSSPDALAISNEKGLMEINDSFERTFHYSREEVQQRSAHDLGLWVHPELRQPILAKASAEGRVSGVRVQFRTKHGEVRECLFSASPMDLNGQPCWLTAARDITGYLRMEEQCGQAQKLEAAGRLAGGVAHDFNNLLTVINGYCQILKRELPATASSEFSLRAMMDAADKAARVTQQLLLFSRKQTVQLEPVALGSVLTDLEAFLRTSLREDIEFHVFFRHDLPAIRADAGLIRHAVVNLAVHAVENMSRGGRLGIEVARVDPRLDHDDAFLSLHPEIPRAVYARITVRDNGPGLDAASLDGIFEPNFEANTLEGLTLTTVQSIIKQMEGYIWAESRLGQGTVFHILLPAEQQDHLARIVSREGQGADIIDPAVAFGSGGTAR